VEGWHDPRFPTIRGKEKKKKSFTRKSPTLSFLGLLRRGLTVAALRDFVLSMGASKNLNLMEMEKLWALNKKIIDPEIPRHFAVYLETKTSMFLSLTPPPQNLSQDRKSSIGI
jgi:glutamyl-tRNA synthetase